MEATTSSGDRHTSLPKLSTSKELCRRDSLSSSRTRDSGYNSDLDASCSPLDFVDSDQHLLYSPFPNTLATVVGSNTFPLKTYQAFQEPLSCHWPNITSNPSPTSITKESKPHCAERLDLVKLNTRSRSTTVCHPKYDLATPDNEIERWIKDNLPSHNRPKERVPSITSLSSSSSCDMYTNTDVSDDEETRHEAAHPSLLHPTAKLIEVIMRKVEVNLRYAAYMHCNGGNTSTCSGGNASVSQEGSRQASQSNGKRKTRSEGRIPPDEHEDDDPNKRRRGSLATVDSSETGPRFACPFYKHEPGRYRNRRTCPGPGWPTVHRMKEHLYRAHAQSIYCPRCYAMFDADIDLSNHLRSQHCQVSAPQPIEGIDRETLKALRKRSPALRLEEDKWRDVYSLLFPAVAETDIPSPFYNSDSPSEDSRRFRRELLRRVQEELVITAGQLPGPVEQQLLNQVAQIIRRCEDELLNSSQGPDATVPSLTERRASATSTASTVSTRTTVTPMPAPPVTSGSSSLPPPAQDLPNSISESGLFPDSPAQIRDAPEQSVQFRTIPWDHPSRQTPSSDWLDWDAIFSSPSDLQLPDVTCNEPHSGFSAPIWTRSQWT